jgi:hypothetical protein
MTAPWTGSASEKNSAFQTGSMDFEIKQGTAANQSYLIMLLYPFSSTGANAL